jgi:dCMP deaminase
MSNWDVWYMDLARTVASKSKDPSTKVGAVIVRANENKLAGSSIGYNGFPQGIADTHERLNNRPMKYSLTIHAEMNALLSSREDLRDCTIYTTLMPCAHCFIHIIQVGIKRCVFPEPTEAEEQRWGESFAKVRALADEAGVILQPYEMPPCAISAKAE